MKEGVNDLYQVGKCRLGYLLKRKGMTQTELADRIDRPKQQIHDYVINRKKMSYQTAFKIAKVLDVPMEELYEWK
jgi:plasmid maintenance system antidote protein VapI